MEQINKLALDVSDLVDLIIDQNSKTGILLKNNAAKKDLVNIIQVAAKQVEAAAYVSQSRYLVAGRLTRCYFLIPSFFLSLFIWHPTPCPL